MRDEQNLITWRWSPPLPTNRVWWGTMHAIVVTDLPTHKHTPPHTHTPTDRTDYNTHAPQLARNVISLLPVYCLVLKCIAFWNIWQRTKLRTAYFQRPKQKNNRCRPTCLNTGTMEEIKREPIRFGKEASNHVATVHLSPYSTSPISYCRK